MSNLFRNPFRTDKRPITSPFGIRIHPITRKKVTHNGIDRAAPAGTRIWSIAPGVVVGKGYNGDIHTGFGHWLRIDHGKVKGKHVESLYAHMQAASHRKLYGTVGQWSWIGRVGMTGAATGPHLHYEVYVDGVRVDPDNYITTH